MCVYGKKKKEREIRRRRGREKFCRRNKISPRGHSNTLADACRSNSEGFRLLLSLHDHATGDRHGFICIKPLFDIGRGTKERDFKCLVLTNCRRRCLGKESNGAPQYGSRALAGTIPRLHHHTPFSRSLAASSFFFPFIHSAICL
ncbi:hypothetical protein PoB_003843400 [Plakobranchus ocellatus]|uniref:Uncharacterized protein n=1 Tax=Plakobranchus ocellatus TaxID=259542 RepID=A0AAV4AVV4_9GAST|nr:hypothetical protein PoB_003843400 [Plakobranchus ocellatus]